MEGIKDIGVAKVVELSLLSWGLFILFLFGLLDHYSSSVESSCDVGAMKLQTMNHHRSPGLNAKH